MPYAPPTLVTPVASAHVAGIGASRQGVFVGLPHGVRHPLALRGPNPCYTHNGHTCCKTRKGWTCGHR